MKKAPIILSFFLFISSLSIQAQMQEEEYDDLYFFAKDREVVAKNALIKAEKREKRRNSIKKQSKRNQVQPRQSLHFNHDLAPQAQFFGIANSPRVSILLGNAMLDPFNSFYYNQPIYNMGMGFNSFYDPRFNVFHDPMMMAFNPWGQSFAFQNRFGGWGWGMNRMNWLWGTQAFRSNFAYGVCPTVPTTAYTTWNNNNNDILRDNRRVVKGARGTRASGIQQLGYNTSVANGRGERTRTTPNYNRASNNDSWNNSKKRDRGSAFDTGNSRTIYKANSSNPSRSSSFGNSSRSRSNSFSSGSSGSRSRSSGSSSGGSRSRTRSRN